MRRLVSPFADDPDPQDPAPQAEQEGRVYAFPGGHDTPTEKQPKVTPSLVVWRAAGKWRRSTTATMKKAVTGDTVFAEQLPSVEEIVHQYRTSTPTDVVPLLLLYRAYGFLVVVPANVLTQTALWLARYPARTLTFLAVERLLVLVSPQARDLIATVIKWLSSAALFLLT